MNLLRVSTALAATLLVACVSMPKGPSVMVLPGTGKSFDQFRYDDVECRQFADVQVGGASTSDIAADSAAKSAVVGTAIGAAAGAALGGRSGAAAGAGGGLLIGSAAGAGAGETSDAPADMYTTTFWSAFPGPVTTFSVIRGLEFNLTHSGCLDMLIGSGFAGLPV